MFEIPVSMSKPDFEISFAYEIKFGRVFQHTCKLKTRDETTEA